MQMCLQLIKIMLVSNFNNLFELINFQQNKNCLNVWLCAGLISSRSSRIKPLSYNHLGLIFLSSFILLTLSSIVHDFPEPVTLIMTFSETWLHSSIDLPPLPRQEVIILSYRFTAVAI